MAERTIDLNADVGKGGEVVPVEVRTRCIHGDTPGAAALARAVRQGLEAVRVGIASPA